MPMMTVSESEGLRKLTEYLGQTKRQAEAAIDSLNEKLVESKQQNVIYLKMIDTLENERDYFKNQVDQLKAQNTTKSKFQERDEWKSLVSSIQQDRSRLQEECNVLSAELEQCKHDITELSAQLDQLLEEREIYMNTASNSTPMSASADNADFDHTVSEAARAYEHSMLSLSSTTSTPSYDDRDAAEQNGRSLRAIKGSGSRSGSGRHPRGNSKDTDRASGNAAEISPYFDRLTNEMKFQNATPHTMSRHLKTELANAQTQIESVQQSAEEERLKHLTELSQLQLQLRVSTVGIGGDQKMDRSVDDIEEYHPGLASSSNDGDTIAGGGGGSWLGSLGFFGQLFVSPHSNNSTRSSNRGGSSSVRGRVGGNSSDTSNSTGKGILRHNKGIMRV